MSIQPSAELSALSVKIQQRRPISLDITFSCQPGDLLALIGPSGSGKTSVLRTIAGLQSAEKSHIHCNGCDWENTSTNTTLKPQQRKVGFVFQQYALFPHLSVLENVLLATPKAARAQRRNKAMQWLEKTNMAGLQNRQPAALSGGQKQRVALARALAREPDVLLLDEPFSAVDQQTRRKLYRELAQLRHHLSIPILLVTHDISEVQLLADKLCLIHRGRSLQQGAVQDVINTPDSKEVARLLGHRNLFSATVLKHDDEQTFYRIGSDDILAGKRRSDLPAGTAVDLLITPSIIKLETTTIRKRAEASSASATNRLQGTVSETIGLRDELSLRLHLESVPKSLRLRIPLHIAQKEVIEQGKTLSVRILSDGIHAMAVT